MYGGKTDQSKQKSFRTVPRGPEIPGNMIRYFDFWGSKSSDFLAKIGVGWKKQILQRSLAGWQRFQFV